MTSDQNYAMKLNYTCCLLQYMYAAACKPCCAWIIKQRLSLKRFLEDSDETNVPGEKWPICEARVWKGSVRGGLSVSHCGHHVPIENRRGDCWPPSEWWSMTSIIASSHRETAIGGLQQQPVLPQLEIEIPFLSSQIYLDFDHFP